jgi:hypothetical protein
MLLIFMAAHHCQDCANPTWPISFALRGSGFGAAAPYPKILWVVTPIAM